MDKEDPSPGSASEAETEVSEDVVQNGRTSSSTAHQYQQLCQYLSLLQQALLVQQSSMGAAAAGLFHHALNTVP